MKNNLACKRIMLWFLVANLLYVPCVQADSSSNVAWMRYIPAASLSMLTGVYVYGLLSPCQDLKNQSQCRYWEKDFIDCLEIYYPKNDYYFLYMNDLQAISNETKTPVIVVDESHVKHVPDNIDLLFEYAKQLAPCIIYIKKDMSRFTALPFYDFNEFADDTTGIFRSSCTRLMNQLKKSQENGDSIIVLGIGQDYDRQSIYDIINLSFNIQYEYPSFKERIEFLRLIFAKRSYKNIDIEALARRTIAFSYADLIALVKKAEQYAMLNPVQAITNFDVHRAFAGIIYQHEVYQYINEEDFYNTCIHEMGHAVMAAHFDEDFILYNATSTPLSTVDDPSENDSLGLTWYGCCESSTSQIDLYKKRIMISLSGRIAEHIFFGLTNNDTLNNQNGYADFIKNPNGATSDLQRAREFADKIYEINGQKPDEILKDMYGLALKLLIFYKDAIERGAKILQQEEFITGSQVYNLLIV